MNFFCFQNDSICSRAAVDQVGMYVVNVLYIVSTFHRLARVKWT